MEKSNASITSSKMQSHDWMSLRHFSISENWGDPHLMERALVFELDNFRHHLGTPVFITSGTRGEHLPTSEHYKGNAVDVVFPEIPHHKLPDIFLEALRFKWMGVGVYTFWRYGTKVTGGLHLDFREGFQRAMWMSERPGDYQPVKWRELTRAFLCV